MSLGTGTGASAALVLQAYSWSEGKHVTPYQRRNSFLALTITLIPSWIKSEKIILPSLPDFRTKLMWLWEMASLLQGKAFKAHLTPHHLRFPLGWFMSIAVLSIRQAGFWGRSLLCVAHDELMHYSKAKSLSIWREGRRPWNMKKTACGRSLTVKGGHEMQREMTSYWIFHFSPSL